MGGARLGRPLLSQGAVRGVHFAVPLESERAREGVRERDGLCENFANESLRAAAKTDMLAPRP